MIYNSTLDLIGNTPLIKIPSTITKLKNINLYCKCELYNPFGSLKDRAALAMIKDDLEDLIKNHKQVIESSSGNTAKALGIICSMHNIPFKNVTNRIKVEEVRSIFRILGINTEELPGLSECPDPTDPNDAIRYIERLASQNPDLVHTDQYTNNKNTLTHYVHTGQEIYQDLNKVDFFFGTLGTTGSSGGITRFLKEKNPHLISIGIIAPKGDNIPGIRNRDEMHEVGIFDSSIYQDILEISSLHAIDGMLTLNRQLGILAGPTSGAAFQSALDYLTSVDQTLTSPQNAVFIACDRIEWYVSYIKKRRPDLFNSGITTENIHNLSDLKSAHSLTHFSDEQFDLIIDLRGNLAYRNSHIPGAINITDFFLEDMVANGLPFSKNQKILLVCVNGEKSLKFSALLNKKGLNTFSLSGGMLEYRNQNLPSESSIERIQL